LFEGDVSEMYVTLELASLARLSGQSGVDC